MNNCNKKNKCGCGLDLAVIPASLGDDTGSQKPYNGAYQDTLVKYEENGHLWFYTHDGVPTFLPSSEAGGTDIFDELIGRPKYADVEMTSETNIPDVDGAVAVETGNREAADINLQSQIDAISASSDVTDIVGTYAALQAYDTSKLKDNDIIKVLQDETHDDETTYYRWSTSTETFTLIGEEGPYYTKSATDTLLAGKQDKLTAGANITIDANNEISATDTTYTHFTGATASTDGVAGLVPAPVAGDEDKALKGDGTWGDVSSQTIFYANLNETGTTRHIYKDASFTTAASAQDIIDANNEGQVILRGTSLVNPTAYNDSYLQNSFIMPHNNDFEFVFLDRDVRYEYSVSTVSDSAFYYSTSEIQPKLTAGTNINISGTTISATDTTYNDFIGTDGTSTGTAGLVPAPLTTDANKFLKSDGTWDTVPGGLSPSTTFWGQTANNGKVDGTISIKYTSSSTRYPTISVGSDNQLRVSDYNNGTTTAIAKFGADNLSTYLYTGLDMNSKRITSVADPTNAQDAATKNYVDTGLSGKQNTLTAGSNISISGDTISATDTTYSNFTGTDGTSAGAAGLVPAPATTDAGKFLKADGTWDTAGGTLYSVTGDNTDGAMTQKATSNLIYPSGYESTQNRIAIGKGARASSDGSIAIGGKNTNFSAANYEGIAIGYNARATGVNGAIAIGRTSLASGDGAIAIGGAPNTSASNDSSIALGDGSRTSRSYELSLGFGTAGSETPYGMRYIAHVADPSLDTDAANKRYVDTHAAVAYTPAEFNTLWEDA